MAKRKKTVGPTTLTFLGGTLVFHVDLPSADLMTSMGREACPVCGQATCDDGDEEGEMLNRLQFNAGLDAIESFLLALICAGVITKSEDPRVNEAIQTALGALACNYP